MIDIKNLTQNYQQIYDNLKNRGYNLEYQKIIDLQEIEKNLKIKIDFFNGLANKNINSKEDKHNLILCKKELIEIQEKLKNFTDNIPNILHNTVPIGKEAKDNIEIKIHIPANYQKNNNIGYLDKTKQIGLDLNAGVDLAGTRFLVMKGEVATKQRKLINKALDYYIEKGYVEHYVPFIVNKNILFGTGQYPKFKDDMFTTQNNQEMFLIPTGEVPLTNLFQNKLLDIKDAENKLVTHTPCFRKEVGAAGKDNNGLIRLHQFEKVELVRTLLPENGIKYLNETLNDIEDFLKTLNIKYRIIELCTGDIGFAGHKAYDIEAYFENQKEYREIATITWCGDFQARRMNLKYKDGKDKKYLHTLNATGLAAGRVLAAIYDN